MGANEGGIGIIMRAITMSWLKANNSYYGKEKLIIFPEDIEIEYDEHLPLKELYLRIIVAITKKWKEALEDKNK